VLGFWYMKIYTKTGDGGETSLIGSRVAKNCLEIEAMGEIDELNGYVGLILAKLNKDLVATQREILYKAQRDLFVIGSNIAGAQIPLSSLPSLREKDIEILENAIDEMQKLLPELKNFILPGGSEIAALCFVARAVCRRGERAVTSLKEKYPKFDILVQKYLNRLSDYLFVLARFLNMVDVVAEQVWRSA
jgi:cob(I)alamin adenosyltransferase